MAMANTVEPCPQLLWHIGEIVNADLNPQLFAGVGSDGRGRELSR